MTSLVYLCGPPAAGKSTLMAALTAGCEKYEVRNTIVPHQRLIDPRDAALIGLEMGRARPDFPGTDTLAMNIAPAAMRWIAALSGADGLILGEGDRLGFPAFLQVALDSGCSVTVVHVTAHPAVLNVRCGERGSAQNVTWRKGRATKAARLALWAAENHCGVVEVDSCTAPARHLAASLRRQVPALAGLPEVPQ